MQIHYCLPILKKTQAEVVAMIAESRNDYDYFEIWLDYIEDLEDSFLEQLAQDLARKVIFLFRRQQLENIHMPFERRVQLLSLLNGSEALVDLDVSSQEEELKHIGEQKLNLNVITSYHNYQQTPDNDTLKDLIKRMETYRPAIYKIATYCQTETDALLLLQLLLALKKESKQAIILGMGKHATITRVAGTLWGNEMIFAPQDRGSSSAPGQLTKSELEAVFKVLT
ncbi:MAG: type I 3-dehydroquinate dehydratase [Patescibacteria group bacterium]